MNSKKKGNKYERIISKKLSLWLSNGERDDLFWRTQSSGGRFTQRMKVGKKTVNQDGDISSTTSESEAFSNMFMIECKNYEDINIWSLITGKQLKNSILDWWNTYKKNADVLNKKLLLVMRQDFKPDIILTNNFFVNILPIAIFKLDEDVYLYKLDDIINTKFSEVLSDNVI